MSLSGNLTVAGKWSPCAVNYDGVDDGDNVFIGCVCFCLYVCVCVRSRRLPVVPKRLKLRTSTCMFPETVRTRSVKIFRKGGC